MDSTESKAPVLGSEADHEERFTAKLTGLGWTINRQIYCRGKSSDKLRPDVYGVAPPEWEGRQYGIDRVLFEMKAVTDTGGGCIKSCFQCWDYMAAHDFRASWRGENLWRPDVCVLVTPRAYTEPPEPGTDMYVLERFLWKGGAALFKRLESGAWGFEVHIGSGSRPREIEMWPAE